jgi:chromate reductase, NAD(P)H dehydrogenase (quinone)
MVSPAVPFVLCLCGSLRQVSSNLALLRQVVALAPPALNASIARPLDRLPHFNPDLDVEPGPAAVEEFRAEVASAAALIISSPEYAFGVPGVLKNALDWLVSSGELYGKPTALITASPNYGGATRARAHLLDTLGAQQALLVEAACVSVPAVRTRFDPEGQRVDPELLRVLRDGLAALEQAVRAAPAG